MQASFGKANRYLLPAILLIAVAVRLWGLGFGLPFIIARPDETEMAGPAVGFLSGDLRPPFFEWPTLFTYTTALLYFVYFHITRPFTGYATLAAFAESRRQSIAPFLYISRSLSVLMGVLTVWWVYSICRRLFDETVALVAALFLALAFLHVRDSHFGVTDVAMSGLVILAVRAVLRWRDSGTLADAGMAGLIGGLAGSTKYNGLAVGVAFLAGMWGQVSRGWKSLAAALAAFGAAMALGFFGPSPYILIDWARFQASVMGVGSHLAAGHGINVGRGWWHFARVVLPAGIGWPMFAAGVLGMLALLVTRTRDAAVLFAFPIVYYLVAGQGHTVFARYIIPVIPFLCVAAAWLVVTVARMALRSAEPHLSQGAIALAALAALAVVAPTAMKTVQLDRLLAATDNRVVVAQALLETPPARSLYQSGEPYGYVPMMMAGRQVGRSVKFDAASGQFDPGEPELVVVQRSPLVLYSAVPSSLEQVLRERYQLVRSFPTGDDRPRAYDQQDAFYLPLGTLTGLTRPGPSFDLYRRRSP